MPTEGRFGALSTYLPIGPLCAALFLATAVDCPRVHPIWVLPVHPPEQDRHPRP